MHARTVFAALAIAVSGGGAAFAAEDEAADSAECPAVFDAIEAPPQLNAEKPEGYVECIAADELYAGLMQFSSDWVTCRDAADAACLADLYDPDAVLVPADDETLHGRAAIEDYFTDMFAGRDEGESARMALSYDSTDANEERAVILQNWREARSGPGGEARSEGRMLQILRPDGAGGWRVWREMTNGGAVDGEDWPEGLF